MTDIKKIKLRFGGDVNIRTRWNVFIQMVEAAGFKVAYYNTFDGMNVNYTEERYKEEEYIFYHEDGFVLYAESCCGNSTHSSINKAKLHYEGIQHSEYHWNGLKPYSGYDGKLEHFVHDSRDSFLGELDLIPNLVNISPVWTIKDPFMRFVNYMEEEEDGYDYRQITRRKIDASVPELRKIIDG